VKCINIVKRVFVKRVFVKRVFVNCMFIKYMFIKLKSKSELIDFVEFINSARIIRNYSKIQKIVIYISRCSSVTFANLLVFFVLTCTEFERTSKKAFDHRSD